MAAPGAAPAADGYRGRFLPVASWALYDFANTIFSAIVVTQYLPRLLHRETGRETTMAYAMAGSLVLSAVLGPFLGAVADATGRTKSQVLLWSGLCCAGGVGLALVPAGHPGWVVAIFVLANTAYNAALSLYDAFLPDVCAPERMGFVSGVGVGVGYLGALVGYPVASWAFAAHGEGAPFAVAGILMAIFTIPFAIWVRERSVGERRRLTAALALREFRAAHATIRSLPSRPALLLFLAGNLLAVDSLNSMIQWAAQFFRDPAAFAAGESQVTWLLVGLSLSGVVFGFLAGRLCDRVGGERILVAAVLALAVVATVDATARSREFAMGTTMVLGGFGAAGTWLAGRRVLVDMAPPERLAEFMGLLGVTRKASVFGTIALATLADARDWRYAILALVAPLLLGALLLLAAHRRRARDAAAAA
jgi:UMF1 family MFS transporter